MDAVPDPPQDVIDRVAGALAEERTPSPYDLACLGRPPTEATYLRISQAVWDLRDRERAVREHERMSDYIRRAQRTQTWT